MTTPHGVPLAYGRAQREFSGAGFIAWGDPGNAAAARARS